MAENKEKKSNLPSSPKRIDRFKEVKEREETTLVETTRIKNRTNQKQVVAFGEETFEFLAGETKKLSITSGKAKEKFSVFLSKNILTIIN